MAIHISEVSLRNFTLGNTFCALQDAPQARADLETPPLGERKTLMYFAGALGVDADGDEDRDPSYSGGARQVGTWRSSCISSTTLHHIGPDRSSMMDTWHLGNREGHCC